MTTLNLKPLAQRLAEQFQSIFANRRSIQLPAEPVHRATFIEPESQDLDADAAFLASIAHLPEVERIERIRRREWYAALAARQAIADVEWREQQYQVSGKALHRS